MNIRAKVIAISLVVSLTAFSCVGLEAVSYNPFEADASQKAKPATIKVLLTEHASRVLLEVKGRYQIFTPSNGLRIATGSSSKREFVTPDPKGMAWGESIPGLTEMRIVPADAQTTIVVNGTQYKGCIEIYDRNGSLYVVNEIDVENYLKAALTVQFPDELDDEIMEAVAIVARTNAYYFLGKNAHSFWHVHAPDVGYQGYGATFQNLCVDKAVENTRHMILTHQGSPFAAAWTKNSAGKTADYASIFRKEVATTHGVSAPFAQKDREKQHWTFTMSKKDLAQALKLSSVTGVDLYLAHDANKVYAVKVHDNQTSKNINFFSFQNRVGEKRLRSNDFSVAVKGDQLVFSGYGDGPGVGLCLYSASKMIEHGESVQKILTTFFPDTKIDNARELPSKAH